MIIAINDNIINTKNIYKITKIKTIDNGGTIQIYFFINFFNKNNLKIKVNYDLWIEIDDETYIYNDSDDIIKTYNNIDYENPYGEALSFISNHKDNKDKLQKLTELREKIIKIWSENQSDIPQFNI